MPQKRIGNGGNGPALTPPKSSPTTTTTTTQDAITSLFGRLTSRIRCETSFPVSSKALGLAVFKRKLAKMFIVVINEAGTAPRADRLERLELRRRGWGPPVEPIRVTPSHTLELALWQTLLEQF
mmetsp:Transcript_27490/g.37693  ORF Transcript_27490/g.37693 Transcript_27490/m.37693 type:complete len:124 (+) Transcript_27490:57-428(+)